MDTEADDSSGYTAPHYGGEIGMLTLKVTATGASSSATLSVEDMAQLKVSQGDTLSLTKAPDGGYRLTRCDGAVARQMPVAERIMQEDREVLRKLAE